MLYTCLACYLVLINALAFLLMLIDKWKARKNLWRIPESTLMMSAALGGSIGALAGMYAVRHKTRKPKFYAGIPLILLVQLSLALFLILKFA